jgi:hypothetical protein
MYLNSLCWVIYNFELVAHFSSLISTNSVIKNVGWDKHDWYLVAFPWQRMCLLSWLLFK